MELKQLTQARQLIKDQPWLIWYTKNYDNLDEEAITEAVLGGNWDDFLNLGRIFGLVELRKIFLNLINKRRVNLRPETINLFKLYFEKHVSTNSN